MDFEGTCKRTERGWAKSMGGYIVYRFSGVSEVLEQRFSTLKLAMRKAYLDWTYRRFLLPGHRSPRRAFF